MDRPQLRVRAVGIARVPDFDAMEGGVRRFVGRQPVAVLAADGTAEWPATGDVAVLPVRREYTDAIAAGELEPADDETARLAGVQRAPDSRKDHQ